MALGVSMLGRWATSTVVSSAAALLATTALAQEITLRSDDGAVNLVGEFIDFIDDNYVIRTDLGDLRISADRVNCTGPGCPSFEPEPASQRVVMSGSDTVAEGVMPLLISGYAANLGAVEEVTVFENAGEVAAELIGDNGFGDPIGSFLVRSSVSGDSFANLLGKSAQIGMSSRRIRPAEARVLRQYGSGNMVDPRSEHIIAVDSLTVITHPSNPVNNLSLEQLRGIFSGEIRNWSEVGGNDQDIVVVQLPDGSGTRSVFESRLFGDTVPGAPWNALRSEGNTQAAALVNENENAIGFVSFAFQRGAKPLSLVNECGIELTPDTFSARTGEYALQRFLYMYTRQDTITETTQSFVDYVTSNAADQVIAKSGFIDLGISRREQSLESGRAQQLSDPSADSYEAGFMQEMLEQMPNYDRLSATFRFRTGSQNLTPRGVLNLERLADYLEGQPDGTKIRFVGFTDDVGAFDANRTLSIARAEQVMASLKELAGDRVAGIDMDVSGYGEIAPAACNTDDNGKGINRRVEVWIANGNG